MTTMTQGASPQQGIDRYGIKRMIEMVVFLVFLGLLFFVSAGRLNWFWAWAYLILYFATIAVNGLVMGTKNPEIINVRGKSHADTKVGIRW